jgi:hypothetical protein
LINAAAQNAIIIANGHRKTIHDVEGVFVQLFPGLTQQVEQGPEMVSQTMPAPIEAAFGEHTRNIPSFLQKAARSFVIPTKEQGSYEGRGHYFGIAHLTLRIFDMIHSFQKIITQAINCYNLGVHVFLLESSGLGSYNFTR